MDNRWFSERKGNCNYNCKISSAAESNILSCVLIKNNLFLSKISSFNKVIDSVSREAKGSSQKIYLGL